MGDKSVLSRVKIISTKVEEVTDRYQTLWVKIWTLHKVEVEPSLSSEVTEQISKSQNGNHLHGWYADYKNEQIHFVIYRDKIF